MARKISARHRKQLARATRRAVQKQQRKKGGGKKRIKIQTAPVWKRLVFAGCGLVFLAIAYYVHDFSIIVAILCGLFSLYTVGISLVGDRKTIDDGLKGADVALSNKAIDAFIDGLL